MLSLFSFIFIIKFLPRNALSLVHRLHSRHHTTRIDYRSTSMIFRSTISSQTYTKSMSKTYSIPHLIAKSSTRMYMSTTSTIATINSNDTSSSTTTPSIINTDSSKSPKYFFNLILDILKLKMKFRYQQLKNSMQSLKSRVSSKRLNIVQTKGSKSFLNSQRGRRPSPLSTLLTSILTTMSQPSFWYKLFVLILGCISLRNHLRYMHSLTLEVPFSSFLKLVNVAPERIENLRIFPGSYLFKIDGKDALTRPVSIEPSLLAALVKSGIDFYAPASPVNIFGIIWSVGYLAFLWNLANKMIQGPSDGAIGKNKNELALDSITFADVAGQDRAKTEVKEICDMLKAPEKFLELGARLPSGVLLCGPPGTGKTLLARVSAAEAGVPFYAVSASEFVEVFVGRGASRVRKLFKLATETAPSIIFIDELDSIGRSRRSMSMNSEQENTLNQLLTCMDGLDTNNNGVIVMAATNRQELLDPALLRAGRFDRVVQCPLPDKVGRTSILKVHTKRLPLDTDVNFDKIARLTPGTCGADLAALANEAAIRAVRRGGSSVNADDFDNALNSFYAGRGVPLSGLAEQIPSWLKGFNSNSDNSPVGAS